MKDRVIGGVFALESESVSAQARSVWEAWTSDARHVHCFHNARSALRHVIEEIAPIRVWLPAYLCSSVTDAVIDASTLRYYPVGSRLVDAPRNWLDTVERGDLVLTINYFGRATLRGIGEQLRGMPEVYWVEDRAQCLANNADTGSDACIYSPRKLFGVPDGGVLVVKDERVAAPSLVEQDDSVFELPYRIRAEDGDGTRREEWFAAFQQAESAMEVGNAAMSRVSRRLLERLDYERIAAARRRNYSYLLEALPDLALWPNFAFEGVPSGFPIVTSEVERLW